ncbi:DUF3995 domain-containing protein [Actinomadura harenae]|uniref:DUF3995 domain-containing protein n=1 Tax=Actinomadura harenae TaxID=2483351 RepID=A0A3M2ME97_9ACTN|nr:DUF3995 domain-containing protein [Actinomadura harenae]RMI47877.1 DUF3995 domain-containing protein [Actinomadura harenae]
MQISPVRTQVAPAPAAPVRPANPAASVRPSAPTAGHTPARRRTAFGRVAVHAAALWGVLFSAVHVYWLADGRLGLPHGRSIYGTPALLVIDVIAVPASLVAAGMALALLRSWGERLPQRMLNTALWGTTALLIVHALPSVPDWIALSTGARDAATLSAEDRFVTFLYEPWFMAGGVLFGLATGLMRRRQSPAHAVHGA